MQPRRPPTPPATGPGSRLKDASGAVKAVPPFKNDLGPAIENLLRGIKGFVNAAPSIHDFTSLDHALAALNDGIFSPINERRGKAEIGVSEVMTVRLRQLARDLSRVSSTCKPPQTSLLGKATSASFTPAVEAFTEGIEKATANFFSEGGFSLEMIQDRPRRYVIQEVFGPPNSSPSLNSLAERNDASGPSGSLTPSIQSVLDICPKFRILVIGKTGVGKSSLIHHAFGVKRVLASDFVAGQATIEDEYTSLINEHFILHDSQGFEPGDMTKYQIVEAFIKKRMDMPELKDKLHVVWLCLPIPFVGGRVFEAGDEAILKTSLSGLPVIAVFTKYDVLVNAKAYDLRTERPGITETKRRFEAEELARQSFEESCVKRLFDTTGNREFPHAKVSIHDTRSMEALVKLTSDCVGKGFGINDEGNRKSDESNAKHAAQAIQLSWDIAQRANMQLNVDASIRIGKRRYWRGLASSIDFPNHRLEDCLAVIHTDIVEVWNFNDEYKCLKGKPFRARLSEVVSDLADEGGSSRRAFLAGAGVIGTGATVISAVVPLAAPAALPVAAAVFFAKWMLDSYNKTPHVLRCMIGYIIDMSLILESLFWLLRTGEDGISTPITRAHLETAVEAYCGLEIKDQIHNEIEEFVKGMKFGAKLDRDVPLEKITDLLEKFKFPLDHYRLNLSKRPSE